MSNVAALRTFILVSSGLLATSCSEGTFLVVHVDGDLEVGSEVDELDVGLWVQGGLLRSEDLRLEPGDTFPQTLRIEPPSDDVLTVDLVLRALRSGRALVQAERVNTFVRGEETRVEVCLWRRCVEAPGGPGCEEGSCDAPEPDGDGDADADGDTDADGDADSDADSDSDADADGDQDADGDADPDGPVGPDGDVSACEDLDGDGGYLGVGAVDPVMVSDSYRGTSLVRPAYGSAGYAVVWPGGSGADWTMNLATVSADGVLTPAPAPIAEPSGGAESIDVVGTGSGYAVGWIHTDYYARDWEVHLAMVSAAGVPEAPPALVASGSGLADDLDLVWTGTEVAASFWCDDEGRMVGGNFCVLRASALGEPLGTVERALPEPAFLSSPALVWTGDGFLFGYRGDGLILRRVTPAGLFEGEPATVHCEEAGREDIIGPSRFDFLWTGSEVWLALGCEQFIDTYSSPEVQVATVAADGSLLSGPTILDTDGRGSYPWIAQHSGEHLIAWNEFEYRGALLSPDLAWRGAVFDLRLDPDRFALASGGGAFAAAWLEEGELSFAYLGVCR